MAVTRKTPKALPRIQRTGNCHQLIVDGKPLILLAAEMQNSSASSLEYLEQQGCWDRLKSYNCNAALVPVYWDRVEPEEGRFDFSLVDGIIRAARRHGLRLVLLWFGTWKNSRSSYAPAYVKTDLARFPRCQLAGGRSSLTVSPFSQAACGADSRAFARLMQHVRKIDADPQTVLMVQVENEIGLLGAERDF
jgi:beta-galactosidase GanA